MSKNNRSDQTLKSYKIIFESSLDAILLTRTDGTIFYANPAAKELFGYNQNGQNQNWEKEQHSISQYISKAKKFGEIF
jgi:PAS domain S-box-containing protein